MTLKRRLWAMAGAAAMMAAGLPGAAVAATAEPTSAPGKPKVAGKEPLRPIVFVHGSQGSANQFQTQGKRFAANGYPSTYIDGLDYDSTFEVQKSAEIFAELDRKIDALLKKTGADKVDLLGHSLGTYMSQTYLKSDPARARRVAHYVNLDGLPASELPGGVKTLAIWGEGSPDRTVVGAKNVQFPGQGHTETVTSKESFAEAFTFFRGKAPRTTGVPLQLGLIQLAGRAVQFPRNVGVTGAKLELFRVNPSTGQRIGKAIGTQKLTGDGSFSFLANGISHYEFAITRPSGHVHHFYSQPARRTDRLIRLLTSEPGTGLDAVTDKSDNHVSVTVSRNKEWWGDQGAGSDSLTVNGTNVLNASTAPRTKRMLGIFAYDAGKDGESNLVQLPAFAGLPFIGGTDLVIQADPQGKGTVKVAQKQRNGRATETLNVPNWPSSKHRISIAFNDYLRQRWAATGCASTARPPC
ncbi:MULTISPECIES: alpha/beta fold hydrolase [Aeromicrobium]|nr:MULTISPECIES: alpha/beta fold hydrolase [Aeromicrobium]